MQQNARRVHAGNQGCARSLSRKQTTKILAKTRTGGRTVGRATDTTRPKVKLTVARNGKGATPSAPKKEACYRLSAENQRPQRRTIQQAANPATPGQMAGPATPENCLVEKKKRVESEKPQRGCKDQNAAVCDGYRWLRRATKLLR